MTLNEYEELLVPKRKALYECTAKDLKPGDIFYYPHHKAHTYVVLENPATSFTFGVGWLLVKIIDTKINQQYGIHENNVVVLLNKGM